MEQPENVTTLTYGAGELFQKIERDILDASSHTEWKHSVWHSLKYIRDWKGQDLPIMREISDSLPLKLSKIEEFELTIHINITFNAF